MNALHPATARRRFIVLSIVCLLIPQAGCQTGAIHRSDDAFFYRDGMWCGTYHTGFPDARAAALTALTELKMPVFREGPQHRGGFIDSRTPDDFPVRIELRALGVRNRAEGEHTRIGVRVGGFGTHRDVCERILNQIAQHLAPGAIPPIAAPVAGTQGQPSAMTAPPQPAPLDPSLPAQPVPVGK
jgi:hypothetical protein